MLTARCSAPCDTHAATAFRVLAFRRWASGREFPHKSGDARPKPFSGYIDTSLGEIVREAYVGAIALRAFGLMIGARLGSEESFERDPKAPRYPKQRTRRNAATGPFVFLHLLVGHPDVHGQFALGPSPQRAVKADFAPDQAVERVRAFAGHRRSLT